MWLNIHFLGVGLKPAVGEHEAGDGPLSKRKCNMALNLLTCFMTLDYMLNLRDVK